MVGLYVGKGLSHGGKCSKGERTYKLGMESKSAGFEVSSVGAAARVLVHTG
jgi:hypothetical protein